MNGRKSFGGGGGGGRGKPATGAQGKDGQRRPMFRRRKVCKFCSDKIDDINYKDVKLLMPFVPERAKILPRRISGTCALHQRKLRTALHARAPAGADPVHGGVGDRDQMEVILREHVDNLGKRGEIVKVADGYARNYLLPRKLALPATDGNSKHVERERKIMETREAEEKGQAEAIASRLGAHRHRRSRAASATPSSSTARSPRRTSPTSSRPRASRSIAAS